MCIRDRLRTEHAFILYEQRDPAADLSDIRLLNSWPGGGIVLITSRELTETERREYLRAGVNSAIAGDMPQKDFLRTLQFMGDYAFTHLSLIHILHGTAGRPSICSPKYTPIWY